MGKARVVDRAGEAGEEEPHATLHPENIRPLTRIMGKGRHTQRL